MLGNGTSGTFGSLVCGSGTNAFVFSGSSKLIGAIQGAGSSTLNYSGYGNRVKVNLGNGTNETATGVTGAISGITAIIGSNYNDTLSAGTVPNVALTGGLGTNTLSGTGNSDSVVESIASAYILTKTSLTGTGSAFFTDTLSGITVATLAGASSGTDLFTVSGWTGSGSLTDSGATGDTVMASSAGGYTLGNGLLQSTNPNSLSLNLSGITTANLTDSSTGSNTFTVTGWTGGGTLKGKSEIPVDSVAASTTLGTTSLVVNGGPTLTLSGFTTANLTDSSTTGGNTFTVDGWTGTGALNDTGAGDTITASTSGGYILNDSLLQSTTSTLSLALTGFATANLTATASGKTFTVSGWTGGGLLTGAGTGDTVIDSDTGSFTLTNNQLTAPSTTLSLSDITTAILKTTAPSGGAATIVDASAFTGVTNLTATGSGNAILYGGTGAKNTLSATGSGGDFLIGNGLTDTLTDTGSGMNILIGGGGGGDTLTGNGNDILVSGATL
jgi:hypothetical protein